MANTEIRLINAVKLEEEAYRRFGLEAVKFITLIQEQPTVQDKREIGTNDTHDTRIEDTPGVTP